MRSANTPPIRLPGPPTLTGLPAAALLLACPPDSDQTTDSPDASTTEASSSSNITIEETTEPTTAATSPPAPRPATCACVLPDGTHDADTCGRGPCGTIEVECSPDFCSPEDQIVLDATAIECALDVLVAGGPGVIEYESAVPAHLFVERGILLLDAERRGITRTESRFDLGCFESDATLVEVKPAGYFAACKDLASPLDRFNCLKEWSADVLETCVAGPGNFECVP